MKKRKLKIVFLFSIMIFVIMFFTLLVISAAVFLLIHLGLVRNSGPKPLLISFALMSLTVGTILSNVGIQKMIRPILEINDAVQRVAKGDFTVKISEGSIMAEVDDMTHNFNLMIQELAGMETLRSDFISNVSHEFKTPLSAIEGYATLLQDRALTPPKRDFYVSKILYNTRRLSTLTGNILLLSRLESQEINNRQELFSLDEQLRQIILLFENRWTDKKLDMDIELESVDYYGNPDLLSHVWQNLIDNAVKFTDVGGRICVRLTQERDAVRVVVSDDGIGMSEEVMAHVFDRFYQGDPSHSTQGNGLGLALARRIVLLHHGSIEAESPAENAHVGKAAGKSSVGEAVERAAGEAASAKAEKGRGTAFVVTLPVEEPTPARS